MTVREPRCQCGENTAASLVLCAVGTLIKVCASLDSFGTAVLAIPHILEAQRLFGDPDYLLRVIARDLPHFQSIYDDTLAMLPGVQKLTSTLVMKTVAENRPLPLE